MRYHFLLPVCLLYLSTALNAQDISQNNYGIGLHYGQPFGDHVNAHHGGLVGVSGYLAFPIKGLPFDYGFGLEYDLFDHVSKPITVRLPDFEVHSGTLVAKNQAYGALPFLRYRPFNDRKVMPYAEVFAGARVFMTRSYITLDDDRIMSKRDRNADIATAWGAATGVMISLGNGMYLHLRYERSWGGQATYADLDTLHVNAQREASFDHMTTATGAWRIHAGLVGYF